MNPFQQQSPIPGIKKIIAVGSGKGGVGKSTVSVNLALALKKLGNKVGLLDADIYGPSLPRMLGALGQKPAFTEDKKMHTVRRHGLSTFSMGYIVDEEQAVVWRGPMLFKAIEQFFKDVEWGEQDYLIIDLPPGTGDVALTVAQKIPVNGAITVCTPQNIALVDAKKAIDMFEKINIPNLGVVENMAYFIPPGSAEKVALFPRGEMDAYLKARHLEKLAEVPFNPSVSLSSEAGIPIVESDPDGSEGQAFIQLAKKVVELV